MHLINASKRHLCCACRGMSYVLHRNRLSTHLGTAQKVWFFACNRLSTHLGTAQSVIFCIWTGALRTSPAHYMEFNYNATNPWIRRNRTISRRGRSLTFWNILRSVGTTTGLSVFMFSSYGGLTMGLNYTGGMPNLLPIISLWEIEILFEVRFTDT